jgi:hypothetical protein
MNICAKIQGSACGLDTMVEASSPDGITVRLRIESDCPKIAAFAAKLGTINAFEEVLGKPLIETLPALAAAECKLHTSCVVLVGVLKAVEAAAGLAVPATATIELRSVD